MIKGIGKSYGNASVKQGEQLFIIILELISKGMGGKILTAHSLGEFTLNE